MSLTRINEFTAALGKADELYTFLSSLISFLTSSKGCEGAELLRSEDDGETLVVIERWLSKEDHASCLAAYPKEQMQAAMSLIGAPPQGRFFRSKS